MSRLLPIVAVALCAALVGFQTPRSGAQPAQAKGTNYAFLVAPADYDANELKKLPYSQKETEEFRQVLIATGFGEKYIKFLHDGQAGDKGEGRRYLPEKKKIVAEFELLLARVGPDDTVLVLLNGHGVHFTGDKTGYFCPVDAKLTDKETLWATDGPGGLFEMLKGCKAKRKLLLVNACRNDPASDRSLAGNKIKLDDEDKDEVPEGIAALYSCKPGQKSYYYDPKDPKTKGRERSLFMHHLIETWRPSGKGGKWTIEDVFQSVQKNTSADADTIFGRPQSPVVRREYKGEWVLEVARPEPGVGAPPEGKKGEEAAKNFKPNGSVLYKNGPTAKAAVIERRGIAATLGEKTPVVGPDGKTVTGYRVELLRGDDSTTLGTFTVGRDKWVYWGGKGASHTMDPSAWRAGDRFAVVLDVDPKLKAARLESIFGADAFKPD